MTGQTDDSQTSTVIDIFQLPPEQLNQFPQNASTTKYKQEIVQYERKEQKYVLHWPQQLPEDLTSYQNQYVFCQLNKRLYFITEQNTAQLINLLNFNDFENFFNQIKQRTTATSCILDRKDAKKYIVDNGGIKTPQKTGLRFQLFTRSEDLLGKGFYGRVFSSKTLRVDDGKASIASINKPRVVKFFTEIYSQKKEERQSHELLHAPAHLHVRGPSNKNQYCLIMHEIPGKDLDVILLDDMSGTLPLTLEDRRQLTLALVDIFNRQVYQPGFIHCDLKPENIKAYKTEDGTWVMNIIDFGLAVFETQKERYMPRGTALFAPMDSKLHPNHDVFSIGRIISLLWGERAFCSVPSLSKLKDNIQQRPLKQLFGKPKLENISTPFKNGLIKLLNKALEANFEERATAQQLIELAAELSKQPLTTEAVEPIRPPDIMSLIAEGNKEKVTEKLKNDPDCINTTYTHFRHCLDTSILFTAITPIQYAAWLVEYEILNLLCEHHQSAETVKDELFSMQSKSRALEIQHGYQPVFVQSYHFPCEDLLNLLEEIEDNETADCTYLYDLRYSWQKLPLAMKTYVRSKLDQASKKTDYISFLDNAKPLTAEQANFITQRDFFSAMRKAVEAFKATISPELANILGKLPPSPPIYCIT